MEDKSSRRNIDENNMSKEINQKVLNLKQKTSSYKCKDKEASDEIKAKEYEDELEKNRGIPRKFIDILEVSPSAKKLYESYYLKLRCIDVLLCVICVAIIIFIYFDNDELISTYNVFTSEYVANGTRNFYRYINIVLNLMSGTLVMIIIILIIWRYSVLLDVHKLRLGKIADRDGLYNARLLPSLLLEILINIIFVPPMVKNPHFTIDGNFCIRDFKKDVIYDYNKVINRNNLLYYNPINHTNSSIDNTTLFTESNTVIKLTYTASTIISILSLFRFYHMARIIYTFSYWTSPRAKSVCKMLNTDNNIIFAIKSYLRIQPFFTLFVSGVLTIAIFGITVKIMEYYNKSLMNLLLSEHGYEYVDVMKEFEYILNSYWLIVVTMTTIGYGDIYPTTYFGRVLVIISCLFGTFTVSLLIVFLNNYILLDEAEKTIFNEVVDEELKEEYLKVDATKIIWNLIKLHYLKTCHKHETILTRMYINLNLKYMTKKFKIQRLNCMKKELDLDEVLNKIKRDITSGLDPLKNNLEEYYHKTIKKDDYINLKESSQLIDAFLKNSKQMWNLVRILKHDKYLEGLTSINEVYDSQVNLLEEIIQYHNMKDSKINKYNFIDSEQSTQNEEGMMKGFDFNQVFDTHNVIDKN